MSFISILMVIFSVLGAVDRIIGNKFGLGKEFEKGFMLFGNMALAMIGMIILSPFIAQILSPVFTWFYSIFHIDPSIIPATIFANDMGGAPLAVEIAKNEQTGLFNALVVSSMMGATVSFTIPYALGIVNPDRHKELLLGLLCGIVTIPGGCFVSGLMCRLPIGTLLLTLLPLVIFSAVIAAGLMLKPDFCVKIFAIIGAFIKIVITIGLSLGVLRFLTGIEIIKNLATLEEGAAVCLNASAVMSGAFPLMYVVSKILTKPLRAFGSKAGISETSAMGLISTLATNATTFEMMNGMDKKGALINSAFAVSAAFTFAGHLAFTMAFNADYITPMIIGKLISGILALILGFVIYRRLYE